MHLERVLSYVVGQPWAIEPRVAEAMVRVLARRAAGERFDELQIEAATSQRSMSSPAQPRRGVAVIPVHGVLAQHAYMVSDISGPRGTSTDNIRRQVIDAVDDPDVIGIVLDIHSPGGSVFGLEELHRTMVTRRDVKPITAAVNSMAASAAYYIASAATEISVTPGGMVGAVGCIALHEDLSKALEMEGIKPTFIVSSRFKAEGNFAEPLGDEARAHLQREVNDYGRMFTNAVARGRGVSTAVVESSFGEGRMVRPSEAVRLRMVDRIETVDQAIARRAKGQAARGPAAIAEETEYAMRLRLSELTGQRS